MWLLIFGCAYCDVDVIYMSYICLFVDWKCKKQKKLKLAVALPRAMVMPSAKL
jgi:hypothetical protein